MGLIMVFLYVYIMYIYHFTIFYFKVLCVCMYVCTLSICRAQSDQGRTPEPLKLELQTVVNYHMGAGNQIWSSPKASGALNH